MEIQRLWLLWGTISVVWMADGPTAQGVEGIPPAVVKPIKLRAEAVALTAGNPLSQRSLVTAPAELRGLIAWTIESRRHRGYIYTFAASPDGKFIATGGIDGTIRIWDAARGVLVRLLVGHDSYVQGLAWSPCGSVLASAGTYDNTIRLWDPHEARLLRTFKAPTTPVQHVAWSPDGSQLLAAGGTSGWTWLWNVERDLVTKPPGVGHYISTIVWSPDGSKVALTGSQMPPTLFDTQTWKVFRSLGTGIDGSLTVAFSSDGRRVATGSTTAVQVWELDKDEVLLKIPGPCTALAWSPDDNCLAVGYSGQVQLFDMPSGKSRTERLVFPGGVSRLHWHSGSRRLLCHGYYGLGMWQFAGDKSGPLATIDAGGSQPPIWYERRPIVTGLSAGPLLLWDSLTTKFLRKCAGHTTAVNVVTWSRDGKLLASAGNDKAVKIWETHTGELQQSLDGHTSYVYALAWSPDGRQLASAGYDKNIRLWDVNGQSRGTLEGHGGVVRALAWAPAGNLLASGGDDERVLLWDRNGKRTAKPIKANRPVASLAWTLAGKITALACGTADDALQIFNGVTGQSLVGLRCPGSPPTVTSMAWLPTGNMLFSGRGNHTCQLWDVPANKVIHNLQAQAPVQYVTLAANGSILVAGNLDRTVRLWDAADCQLRGYVLDESGYIVMITADGHWKMDAEKQCDLAYVAQLEDRQVTLTPDEFAARFRWKNNPARVRLTVR